MYRTDNPLLFCGFCILFFSFLRNLNKRERGNEVTKDSSFQRFEIKENTQKVNKILVFKSQRGMIRVIQFCCETKGKRRKKKECGLGEENNEFSQTYILT